MRRSIITLMLAVAVGMLWAGNYAFSESRGRSSLTNAPEVVLATSTGASYNWAGYVAEDGFYTAVSGTWIVPEVSPTDAELSGNATWVGIGGVDTHDLIQAGTQALITAEGDVLYQAWYEMLPEPSVPVSLRIRPGDEVTAAVTYSGEGRWHISIANTTTGRAFSRDVEYESSFSSAEWIEEMPLSARTLQLIALPHYEAVAFVRGSAVKNGEAQTLAETGAQPLRMINYDYAALAEPTTISKSGSFWVVRTPAEATAPTRRAVPVRVLILQI
jgi:hypothetical protein